MSLHRNTYSLIAVYSAQALSAFADNAILIVAIALLKSTEQSTQIPWLQALFVLPFVLLAPFAGVLADGVDKGRVMMLGNGLKFIGALGLLLDFNLLASYALVGIGAAIYSPAKYGILGQLVCAEKLVKANGWMEASTLVAILLGVVVGGLLADQMQLPHALLILLAIYALAAILTQAIQPLGIERPYQGESVAQLIVNFWRQVRQLSTDHSARFSLLGTSLFWAMGSSLRLMLFAWVPVALLVTDNQLPANLMGLVSIGIIVGAAMVAWRLALSQAHHARWGGLLLAPLLIALTYTTSLNWAIVFLLLLGMAGGWFIVPLNALLQHRGQQQTGTGRALAVQNLFENTAMLLAVTSYGVMQPYLSIHSILLIFASCLALGMLMLKSSHRRP